MEKVCPLCNVLQLITEKCPRCGASLVDGGAVSAYMGPYSPYMDTQDLPFQSENYCLHLLYCPVCQYDTRSAVAFVTM
ncbi:MAG: hypothetical protein H6Q71_383 [Firmicutes bacterium]|nr:hypothetical protein [Bacillota bacterium]